VLEALRVRVKDIDFDYRQVLVRDGKGAKDRVTMLPDGLVEPLRNYLPRVTRIDGSIARGEDVLPGPWCTTHVLNRGGRGVRSPLDLVAS
jgi:integrase